MRRSGGLWLDLLGGVIECGGFFFFFLDQSARVSFTLND